MSHFGFGFSLWCYYRAIYCFALIWHRFTSLTTGAGYILFDKALCNCKLEEAWIVTEKNEWLVCIFGSEVAPKIPDDFKHACLPGTT